MQNGQKSNVKKCQKIANFYSFDRSYFSISLQRPGSLFFGDLVWDFFLLKIGWGLILGWRAGEMAWSNSVQVKFQKSFWDSTPSCVSRVADESFFFSAMESQPPPPARQAFLFRVQHREPTRFAWGVALRMAEDPMLCLVTKRILDPTFLQTVAFSVHPISLPIIFA